MARGGKRAGSGRPRGAATKRSQDIADRASADGITPLEVMLHAMRQHYDAQEWDQAASAAKDAAPYMHPRLAATELSGKDGGPMIVQIVQFGDSAGSDGKSG